MKIKDIKDTNFEHSGSYYDQIDEELLKCNSISKQKEILLKRYNREFKRDELISRKIQLENILEFNSKFKMIQMWDVYKSIILSIISATTSTLIDDVLEVMFKNVKTNSFILMKTLVLIGVVGLLMFMIYKMVKKELKNIIKEKHDNEIPVYEINKIELNLITNLLNSNKTELSEAELKKMIMDMQKVS